MFPAREWRRFLLRLALGYVYFHFGILKFYPDFSPAEMIGTQSILAVLGTGLPAPTALKALAILEIAIGIGFLFGLMPRLTRALFTIHIAGTFLPLAVFPELTFQFFPFAPTFEGQYVLKNLVLLTAGWIAFEADGAARQGPSLPEAKAPFVGRCSPGNNITV